MPNSFSQLSQEDRNKVLAFMYKKVLTQQAIKRNTSRLVARPNWRRQNIPIGGGQAIRKGGCNCGK